MTIYWRRMNCMKTFFRRHLDKTFIAVVTFFFTVIKWYICYWFFNLLVKLIVIIFNLYRWQVIYLFVLIVWNDHWNTDTLLISSPFYKYSYLNSYCAENSLHLWIYLGITPNQFNYRKHCFNNLPYLYY